MPSDNRTTPNLWNDIWVAMQELGAALDPVIDSDRVPRWAARLSAALRAADIPVTELALKETDNG